MDVDTISLKLQAHRPRRIRSDPSACVAMILVPGPDGAEVLLIRRAEREGDPFSGHMAFPGGHRDVGDASAVATAVRETVEETGILLEATHLLGELEDVEPRSVGDLVVRPFVFALAARPSLRLSAEVADSLWVSLSEFERSAAMVNVEYGGVTLCVGAFRCGSHVVWGLTHRILSRFLELFRTPVEA